MSHVTRCHVACPLAGPRRRAVSATTGTTVPYIACPMSSNFLLKIGCFLLHHKRPPASCMSFLWHAPRGACIIHPTLLACPKQPRPTEHLDDATYVPDAIAVINHYGPCLWCKGIFQSRFSCSPSVPARSLHVSLNYHNHEAHQVCDILHQIQPTFFPLPY